MDEKRPFNPLDKLSLATSITQAMLSRPVEPLPPSDSFRGAGIYAIYYSGPFELYAPISKANRTKCVWPIYVGKAEDKSRKGSLDLGNETEEKLYSRLKEHAKSIELASNLELLDFRCRFLVTDEIWVPLGETLLLSTFRPLWNQVVEGFGIHDPGGGRRLQAKSSWDELHPGRPWVSKQGASKKTKCEIVHEIRDYFTTHSPRSA